MILRLTVLTLILSAVCFAQPPEEVWNQERVNQVSASGFRFLRSGNWEKAENSFLTLPERFRANAYISYGLGLSQFNLGKIDEAEKSLSIALTALRQNRSNDPLLTETLVLSAIISSKKSDDVASVRKLREALTISPKSFDVNFGLARALYGNGDYKGAEIYFRESVRLNPNHPKARFFHATVLERLGENEKALTAYRAMLRANPDDLNANLGLGVLLSKVEGEDSIEATKALMKVVSANPDHYEAQVTLGKNLIKQNRFESAIPHLEKAAVLKPDNPEPQYQLVIAYRRAGMKEKSKAAAKRVKEIHENNRGKTG